MPLLVIDASNTASEARDWLAELLDDILDRLDMEECVGLVNGDAIVQEVIRQVGYLPPLEIDKLFEGAIEALLED